MPSSLRNSICWYQWTRPCYGICGNSEIKSGSKLYNTETEIPYSYAIKVKTGFIFKDWTELAQSDDFSWCDKFLDFLHKGVTYVTE